MKRFFLLLLIASLALSSCVYSRGTFELFENEEGTSKGVDGANDQVPLSGSSKWDEMKWDQGTWSQ